MRCGDEQSSARDELHRHTSHLPRTVSREAYGKHFPPFLQAGQTGQTVDTRQAGYMGQTKTIGIDG